MKSTAPRTPGRSGSTANVGPESRSQNSSTPASMISISLDSMRRARASSLGSTSIVTGSNSATAWATAAQAA